MKITEKRPSIITLSCNQERGDPDYGKCMWARFYFDLDHYTLSVESDCGTYGYGWIPTPDSETFMHLATRFDKYYLLRKLSDTTVVDSLETFKQIKSYLNAIYAMDREGNFYTSSLDWDGIREACEYNVETSIVDAVMSYIPIGLYEHVNTYELCECIQKDYPASAKNLVDIFCTHVIPYIKQNLQQYL